jgi:hypothetical protein
MDTIKVTQMVVRVCGFVALLFGVMIWIGNVRLTNIHMMLGFILVLALWVLSVFAFRAKLAVLGVLGIVMGLVVAGLGNAQKSMMLGDSHWVIRVVHLLVGIIAIGVAESIAKRARDRAGRGTAA